MGRVHGVLHRVGSMGPVLIAVLLLAGCGQLVQSRAAPTVWDSPLPHSAKGYELYSWPAEQGDKWQFTLITGTNRLKTLEEIMPAEDAVSESEWVRVSATGTDGLKTLLGQLPRGEIITWISREWLEQAGGQAGNVRLPEETVIGEVEGYCRQFGIELSITE